MKTALTRRALLQATGAGVLTMLMGSVTLADPLDVPDAEMLVIPAGPFRMRTPSVQTAKLAKAGGTARRVIFQTWYRFPEKVVPEDEPYTMTNLVRTGIERFRGH